jgi:hypothetical protein
MNEREIKLVENNHHLFRKIKTNNSWRRCEGCGKYISYNQMEELKDVTYIFVSDSEITTEESYYIHYKCLFKNRKPLLSQI